MYSAPARVLAVPLPLQRGDHDGGVFLNLTPVLQRGLELNLTCLRVRAHDTYQRTLTAGAAVQNETPGSIAGMSEWGALRRHVTGT